jgi:sRNA-binding protein
MAKRKSKFRYALWLLAPLKRPLFYKMLKAGRAYPMVKGIHLALIAAMPERERQTRRGLDTLTGTRRYQRALLEENAIRFDADGEPFESVSDADREHAKLRLKNLNRKAVIRGEG